MSFEELVYPECAVRPERFASQLEAVDCANKTARLSSTILVSLTMVGVIMYIYFSGGIGYAWVVVMGVLLIASIQIFTSGWIAERKWRANDTKIIQIMQMTPGMNRGDAAEKVIRENMAQEANTIAADAARSQSRMSTTLALNTGLNFANMMRAQK